MVGQTLSLCKQTPRSLRDSLGELEVIIPQKVDDNHLDLTIRKKPSWASMPSISKCHTFEIARGVYHSRGIGMIGLTQFRKTKPVELIWIGVEVGIHGDGLGGHTDIGACRDKVSVLEAVIASDDSLEGD